MRSLQRTTPPTRRLSIAVIGVLALGLAACESDTAGSEAGADVAAVQEEVAALEEQVTGLEERVNAMEEGQDTLATGSAGDVVGIDEFYRSADDYVGDEITVSAEVGAIISTNAFTLTGPTDELLVLSATGAGDSPVVEPSAPVQVTGTVREGFDIASYEEEFGVDLDDALFEEWTGEDYIAADSVSEPSTDTEETDS